MKVDNNVFSRPKCKCGEFAMIFFGNVPVCGTCAVKINDYNNKLILNKLEEIHKW